MLVMEEAAVATCFKISTRLPETTEENCDKPRSHSLFCG
jgi:hypothetical protein